MEMLIVVIVSCLIAGFVRGLMGGGNQPQRPTRNTATGGPSMLGTMVSAGIGAAAGTAIGEAMFGDDEAAAAEEPVEEPVMDDEPADFGGDWEF